MSPGSRMSQKEACLACVATGPSACRSCPWGPVKESGVHSTLTLVESLTQPCPDGREGSPWSEHLGDPQILEDRDVCGRDDPSDQDQDIFPALLPEPVDDPRHQREVGPGKQG